MRETDLEAVRLVTMNLFDIVPFEEEKEIEGLGLCSHPFATSLFIPDRSNNSLIDLRNPEHAKQYRMWIEEVVKNSSPSRILYRVEKAYRMTWFRLVSPYLSDADYGTLLKDSWITEEDPNQDKNVPQKIAVSKYIFIYNPCRHSFCKCLKPAFNKLILDIFFIKRGMKNIEIFI